MLCHEYATGCQHKGCRSGNIEGVLGITAGAAVAHYRLLMGHMRGMGNQRPGKACNLIHNLSLHLQHGQKAGNLALIGLAGQDNIHGPACLLLSQVLTVHNLRNILLQHNNYFLSSFRKKIKKPFRSMYNTVYTDYTWGEMVSLCHPISTSYPEP